MSDLDTTARRMTFLSTAALTVLLARVGGSVTFTEAEYREVVERYGEQHGCRRIGGAVEPQVTHLLRFDSLTARRPEASPLMTCRFRALAVDGDRYGRTIGPFGTLRDTEAVNVPRLVVSHVLEYCRV